MVLRPAATPAQPSRLKLPSLASGRETCTYVGREPQLGQCLQRGYAWAAPASGSGAKRCCEVALELASCPNYALQQTRADGIRLCPSIRLVHVRYREREGHGPSQLNAGVRRHPIFE